MNDNSQLSKLASAALALLLLALGGYGVWHPNLQSPRPYSLGAAAHNLLPGDTHKVESRLWQDPFEAFDSATNSAAAPAEPPKAASSGLAFSLSAQSLGLGFNSEFRLSTTPSPATLPDHTFWDDLNHRVAIAETNIAVLGVMLEGGSYPEDKEVRLRLRYAVEVALLTAGLGPEDRTHIATNAVWLPHAGPGDFGRYSKFAYEWFATRKEAQNLQTCVLWLNEDDFADDPAWHLGSLLTKCPALSQAGGPLSFYLVGPRTSDTLRAFAQSLHDTNHSANLLAVTRQGHFHIVSPEATASINETNNYGDNDGTNAAQTFSHYLGTNVFNNWITTDQQLASLIAEEITNRMTVRELARTNNVVVLLSEQDTYYGSKLALEWSDALYNARVIQGQDLGHVWQFAYLRGLDGSKPATGNEETSPDLAASPEAALQSALAKQQTGEKADGDAQLDYVMRLGEYLKEKDEQLKNQAGGRIVAVGLTGSDAYDKLILLQELRPLLPGTVFFTSDLDAPLWTARELPYTRNLLVGSAFSPAPDFELVQDTRSEFEPFRDVYQKAVFMACFAVVSGELNGGGTNRLPAVPDLFGGVYEIGRHLPVRLALPGDPAADGKLNDKNFQVGGVLAAGISEFLACLAGGVMGVFLIAVFANGFQRPVTSGATPHPGGPIQDAEDQERARQIPGLWLFIGFVIGVIALLVYGTARCIASQSGEEPWNFADGLSIWASEFIRALVVLGGVTFFVLVGYQRQKYRQTLWEKYFKDGTPQPGQKKNWLDVWKQFRQERWKPERPPDLTSAIVKQDAQDLCAQAGKKDAKTEEFLPQAARQLEQERKAGLIFDWMPPFVENPDDKAGTACVHTLALFRCYFRLGLFLKRLGRMMVYLAFYVLVAGSILVARHDIPTTFNIRGHYSHLFDLIASVASATTALLVLFYVLDGALLTKRLLDAISRYPTRWPERPLRQRAVQFAVQPKHLDGLLDVDFAALQTDELRPFMLWPIFLVLALALSRSTWLDNWSWPMGLKLVFVATFVAAAVGWWIVRRSAREVRQYALKQLDAYKQEIGNSEAEIPGISKTEALSDENVKPPKEVYLSHLEAVRKAIQEEQRGAYAKWFQDPTFLAVFIPSGLTGLIPFLGWLMPNK